MNTEITVAAADIARVGEGPFWDAATGTLHWVDILGGAISVARLASLQAARRTHSPSGTIKPVCSARGMNSAGEIMPRSGWGHRASASKLLIAPVLASLMGWK